MAASEQGHEAVVQLLLARNAEVDKPDNNGSTALMVASFKGREAIVRQLLTRGAKVDKPNNNGSTALMLACGQGSEAIVRLLLARGADVNNTDNDGETALIWASRQGHEAVVRMLLTRDAEVDKPTLFGWTALMSASKKGHEAVVRLLLERGVEVNQPNIVGSTALMLACGQGSEAVVRLLLENGAEVNKTNKDSKSALMLASGQGHEAVVRLLLKNGAEINKTSINGCTALMVASMNGYKEVVRLLLTKVIEANHTDTAFHIWVALMLACEEGKFEVISFLLNQNGDIWAEEICPASKIDGSCIELLGYTPFDLAKAKGHKDITTYLSQHQSKWRRLMHRASLEARAKFLSPQYYLHLTRWRSIVNLPQGTINHCETYLSSGDDPSYVYRNLACYYHVMGHIEKANQIFIKAVETNPCANTYTEYGHFLYQNKRYNAAVIQFHKALQQSDNSELSYSKFHKAVSEPHLATFIPEQGQIEVNSAILALYLLMQCYRKLEDDVNLSCTLVHLVNYMRIHQLEIKLHQIELAYKLLAGFFDDGNDKKEAQLFRGLAKMIAVAAKLQSLPSNLDYSDFSSLDLHTQPKQNQKPVNIHTLSKNKQSKGKEKTTSKIARQNKTTPGSASTSVPSDLPKTGTSISVQKNDYTRMQSALDKLNSNALP